MRIFVAEDDAVSRRLLEVRLSRWGYDVVSCANGKEALDRIQAESGPRLVILDWMMPELDGVEVCRRLRSEAKGEYNYIIILTAKVQEQDLVAGFEAGADDYITKPFQETELHSRIRAAERIINLQGDLQRKVRELASALDHVRTLQGLLPICMHCHKVRNEKNLWQKLEAYIEEHSDTRFSHALCEECLEKYYPEVAQSRSEKTPTR
jgi:DNA-binding response OmpR family regulator